MAEQLIKDAIQELKRLKVVDGPSDENRKATWYLVQALDALNPDSPEIESGPDLPPIAEESPSVKTDKPDNGAEQKEEGSTPSQEGESTEGPGISTGEEVPPTGKVVSGAAKITGPPVIRASKITNAFSGRPSLGNGEADSGSD